jgi:hypothetical protein
MRTKDMLKNMSIFIQGKEQQISGLFDKKMTEE